MKFWQVGLLSLGLVGCAQTPENPAPPPAQSAVVTACAETLTQKDERQAPYAYQQAFLACQTPIRDEALVRRYVDSLILTGQYQGIKSGAAFPENVAPELVEQWRRWAKENL
ncbi:hypothetical protein BTO01_26495 [Vibrio jasicida]|uniref:hypothetical protein n=1 Tax=Vibrio jasicida TaxID=766224 RepID=UPI000CF3A8AA|nr:hypothetical protein [Vibrio jasicida]PQJ49893.1 hypothetical protein BTO01_26495 [Vibrio jasicida]